jgi:hypothetical protein
MKAQIGILVLTLCTSCLVVKAQEYTTITRATNYDIGDNLDLNAVASIFGQSKDLQDFEYRLNDPDNRISNLDLNNDGYVDYLRVVEDSNDQNSLIVIQAVLDKDVYQDVATIEIQREPDGNHHVQIVGDSWLYGTNYIIEPMFVRPPLIFSFFWGPRYEAWISPFYWDYYPRWFYSYRAFPTFRYRRDVSMYVDRRVEFHRMNDRRFQISHERFNQIRRDDFANRHPDRSFENRHRESTTFPGQRGSSRPSDNQQQRRFEDNNGRINQNIRREPEQNGRNNERQQIYQDRQREMQQRQIQQSREQQQNAPQSRPDAGQNSRGRIETQQQNSKGRTGTVTQKTQKQQNTQNKNNSVKKENKEKRRE